MSKCMWVVFKRSYERVFLAGLAGFLHGTIRTPLFNSTLERGCYESATNTNGN
jgi:hypothetical protein